MTFDFDTPIDRRGTDSAKWDRYRGRDVLPMWLADMDFRSPPAVIEALRGRVAHGVFGYAEPPQELYETIPATLQRDYAWAVEPEWLVWLPGVMVGVNLACSITGQDGDDVLTAVPIYPPFLSAPQGSRRNLVAVPMMQRGGRWQFDFDRLEAAITPRARVLLLCNPHNPIGRVFARDELAPLADICLRHDLIISSDEIHCGLVLDAALRHVPLAALAPEVAARTLTFMAPSKTFNLPSLCCAFAVVPDRELRRRLIKAVEAVGAEFSALGFTAALAAYRDGEPWRQALLDYLRGNRDLVEHEVGSIKGLSMSHVEATYLAWIDARPLGRDEPGKFFEAAGVGLLDGKFFGTPGFVRLNFACPRSLLREGLARLRRAAESL